MLIAIILIGHIFPMRIYAHKTVYNTQPAENVSIKDVSEIEGISAIGYLPIWRVALTDKGLDVGMSSLNQGIFNYENIEHIPNGWRIESQKQNISISLVIKHQPTICTMSKQWYPFAATLTVTKPGQPQKTYKGTAIKDNQKPLAPHPAKTALKLFDNTNNETVYQYIDMIKFCLMSKNYQLLSKKLCYPIRFNSSESSYIITDSQMFISKADQIFSEEISKAINTCKYNELYKDGDNIGIAKGIITLGLNNGNLTITTLNIN